MHEGRYSDGLSTSWKRTFGLLLFMNVGVNSHFLAHSFVHKGPELVVVQEQGALERLCEHEAGQPLDLNGELYSVHVREVEENDGTLAYRLSVTGDAQNIQALACNTSTGDEWHLEREPTVESMTREIDAAYVDIVVHARRDN